LFAVLVSWSPVFAQQSIFQSSDGQTAIYLGRTGDKGVALVNFGNTKATIGWLHAVSGPEWNWGFDLNGTAQNGIVSIIRNGAPQTGVGGDFNVNKANLRFHGQDPRKLGPKSGVGDPSKGVVGRAARGAHSFCGDWIAFQLSYLRTSLNTEASDTPPLKPAQAHNFDSYAFRFAYDTLWKPRVGDIVAGFSAGVTRQNNTDELKTVTVSSSVLTTLQNSQAILLSSSSKTAYLGDYQKYIGAPINADILWFPQVLGLNKTQYDNINVPNGGGDRIAIDLYERSNVGEAFRYAAPGIGIFLVKEGDPTKAFGGVTATYKNGKAQLALVTGWTF
jgi:hypothetical protein